MLSFVYVASRREELKVTDELIQPQASFQQEIRKCGNVLLLYLMVLAVVNLQVVDFVTKDQIGTPCFDSFI